MCDSNPNPKPAQIDHCASINDLSQLTIYLFILIDIIHFEMPFRPIYRSKFHHFDHFFE